MKKYLITSQGDAKTLAREVNRLHAEISTLMISTLEKAIRAGGLLTELKLRIGHGGWRLWIEKNLDFSYRTARRYLYVYNNRDQIAGAKTVHQAQTLLDGKEHGQEAMAAGYAKIRRSLVSPVRLARARLRKLSDVGDSAEMIEAILEELRNEVRGLLSDLEE